MIGVLAISVLGVLCVGLGALIAYRERAHDAERDRLLDRVQAPSVAQAAAAMRMMPAPPEREPDPDVFITPTDDDLLLDRQLDPI